MAADEDFLGRWSRLKQARRRGEKTARAEAPPNEDAGAETPPADAAADGAAAADLPPVETLTADSDFTPFMREGVPDEVRNLALRKLWRSDPVLGNLDGLNDYDEDFGAVMAAGMEAMRRLAEAAREAADRGSSDGGDAPPREGGGAEAAAAARAEPSESDSG